MSVGIAGTLVLDIDNCIRLDVSNDRLVNLVWPPGYSVNSVSTSVINVIGSDARIVGTVNTDYIGGGVFVEDLAILGELQCVDPLNTTFWNATIS